MKLFLCEKPSQARNIAQVLGVRQKGEGCLKDSTRIVTWCFGHLLEMAPPDAYDESYKRWRFDTLPIVPEQWKLTVKKKARQQFNVVKQLLRESSEVVVATDADREGETIAREVLERCRWRGPVSRLWLSALDDTSIRKALANLLPGSKTEPLYFAGLGRARADWLVGMNLTRAYTLIGQQRGHDGVLSVGRVQTPTLNLVVQRDLTIEQFEPSPYYTVNGEFGVTAGQFMAKWLAPKAVVDAEGRCINEQAARAVVQKITGQQGRISKADTKREKEPAPLPFDLSSLQQTASKRWGMGAKEVLDTAQALYETHKALTYPRTDCPYLPTSQRGEAAQVLSALRQSDARYGPFIDQADIHFRSRAWNDKKITAHHAIIPTSTPTNITRMTDKERRLFSLVCRRYIAQFYPLYEYDKTTIEVSVCDEQFRAVGRVPRIEGWRTVLAQSKPEKQDDENQTLPAVSVGDIAKVLNAAVETKQTKPPAHYTEGTLIAAMKSIGKLISDAKLKKVLRETSGIGTEATRAGIIETLLQRDFLQKQKKQIVSTQTGRALIAILPDDIKDPATTALWEQRLEDIAQGRGELSGFINGQAQWITEVLQLAKQQAGSNHHASQQPLFENKAAGNVGGKKKVGRKVSNKAGNKAGRYVKKNAANNTVNFPENSSDSSAGKHADNRAASNDQAQHACPDCGKSLQRRKGKNGFFWGCSGYPNCKTTRPDSRGKPGKAKTPATARKAPRSNTRELPAKTGASCPQCKSGTLVQRSVKTGMNIGKPFVGCTGYPTCRYFSWPSN